MTVTRLLSEAPSLELSLWQKFLTVEAQRRADEDETRRLERDIGV